MTRGRIYHSTLSSSEWTAMDETRYEAEEVLQRLLADHPDLLAGEQMRPSEPPRWLLITREVGILDSEGGLARWSLDHLFVDQNATPTLVEVKRSTDTRVRREVVGQMLDYAANGVAHWPPGSLRELYERRVRASGGEPHASLLSFLRVPATEAEADDDPIDAFWSRVDENLRLRQMRLLFVADTIPRELQRIIEFLMRRWQRRRFWQSRFANSSARVIG
jgi:hypothetical protein